MPIRGSVDLQPSEQLDLGLFEVLLRDGAGFAALVEVLNELQKLLGRRFPFARDHRHGVRVVTLQFFAVYRSPALKPLGGRLAAREQAGEQQMLAMARAIASNPKCLLVDEMSLGLAPIIVERLLPIVRDIADETGAGVMVVEQHVAMALEVCDRAYVMNHGQLAMSGTAEEMMEHREELEASYLGEASLA